MNSKGVQGYKKLYKRCTKGVQGTKSSSCSFNNHVVSCKTVFISNSHFSRAINTINLEKIRRSVHFLCLINVIGLRIFITLHNNKYICVYCDNYRYISPIYQGLSFEQSRFLESTFANRDNIIYGLKRTKLMNFINGI